MTLDLLQTREWLIEPSALQAMASAAQRVDAPEAFLAAAPQKPEPSSLLSVADGVGTIDISGPIFRRPGLVARLFMGATDSEEIAAAIAEAGARADIKAVMLNIDSPGGMVLGTPELASAVRELDASKPVYAFTSGVMASAAYWIASQARAIYATPSAVVGSIGVVQAVLDQSAALQKAGLKVEVFSVGKYKAAGMPGTSLTDEQRDLIQSNLEEVAADFHAAVLARGRAIPAAAMEGQTFSGRTAQRYNMAGVVSGLPEAMRRLSTYAAVDTAARVMSAAVAIEDQFAAASEELVQLRETVEAHATAAAETAAALDALTSERDTLAGAIEPIKAALLAAESEVETLRAQVAALAESQAEFDAKVQAEAAKIVAQTGTSLPAAITPERPAALTLSRDEFNALPHAARNEFFRNGGRIG